MRLSVTDIALATAGELIAQGAGADEPIEGITWDSRTVTPGCLYVALVGERVDGHSFIAAAVAAGARCVIASQELSDKAKAAVQEAGASVVRVADGSAAITDLARLWRGRLSATVVGLTGSCGKTTTKNLTRDVLAAQGSVVATKANQNNELGVPNTVLSADEDTQFLVVEMGMRGLGQISELAAFAKPDWGIVTNVGESHIELLGSRENIARAKSELLRSLPEGGIAIVNAADDMTEALCGFGQLAERGVERIPYDGSGKAAPAADAGRAVWAEDVSLDAQGRPSFTLCARGFSGAGDAGVEQQPCELALSGAHNVSNACAAAAAGLCAGMSLQAVAAALANSLPESGRQEIIQAPAGFTVVNDAYNANPDSMRASLKTFAALAVSGRRIAVLGDMGELGDFGHEGHREMGTLVAQLGIDRLICVGSLARLIGEAAQEAGMSAQSISYVSDAQAALDELSGAVSAGDAVLVKASHSVGLEAVVEGLVA